MIPPQNSDSTGFGVVEADYISPLQQDLSEVTHCKGVDDFEGILTAIRRPHLRPMTDTLALVLAGGRGSRLGPLTTRRAKPALPIVRHHRIIDFTLSNCVNSGIPTIGVLTQYMAHSLLPHLEAWNMTTPGHVIRALQAGRDDGYTGTADAIHQNRDVIRTLSPSTVLVLAADHVYKMDYRAMLAAHLENRARITVGCIEVPIAQAHSFGIMEVEPDGRISQFIEKPVAPRPVPGRDDVALASMGIYIFDTSFLLRLLAEDAERLGSAHDFGKDVIPAAIQGGDVFAFHLRDLRDSRRQGYWRDVGTIDAYWRTAQELAAGILELDLEDKAWPIMAKPQPPATSRIDARTKPQRTAASFSLPQRKVKVDHRGSVLFPGAQVGAGAIVEDSVVLPGAVIGAGSIIRKAIVDEGCQLADGTTVGGDECSRTNPLSAEGVILVTADSCPQGNPYAPQLSRLVA